MNSIDLNKNDVLNYITEEINKNKCGYYYVDSNLYHHNSSYEDGASICKNGILTAQSLFNRKIKKYSSDYMNNLKNDDFHVNGIDSVSLSLVGLDDLYDDEYEYNPLNFYLIDFLVSSSLNTDRSSINYGNEFLFYGDIGVDKLISLDFRLLKLIELLNKKSYLLNISIEDIVLKYNELINISDVIKDLNLNIALREMLFEDSSLIDIEKISCSKRIMLK